MNISKHIADAAAASGFDQALLQNIWNNKQSAWRFSVDVQSTSRSNLSRKLFVYYRYKGVALDITKELAALLSLPYDQFSGLTLKGGGSNMPFVLLVQFYKAIKSANFKTPMNQIRAVNFVNMM